MPDPVDDLAALLKKAAGHQMTLRERIEQRVGYVVAESGQTREVVLAVLHDEREMLEALERLAAAERVCKAAADVINWTGEDLLNGRPFVMVSDVYHDALTAWRATQQETTDAAR